MPDLDLSLAPSADAIRRKEFGTVRRGYDVDQVRDYLYAVAEQLESLEREVNEAKMAAAERAAAAGRARPPPRPTPTRRSPRSSRVCWAPRTRRPTGS